MQHAVHSETLNLPSVAAIGFLLTLLPLPIMDIYLMTFHVCLHHVAMLVECLPAVYKAPALLSSMV